VLYLAVTLLFRALPGDDRDWPWHLVAAVLAIAVAADVLRQVSSARPNPRQAGVAVIAWGIGVFFLTPIVVAISVAGRVLNRPVIRKVSLTP